MGDLISKSALIKNIREISTSLFNEWDTAGVMSVVYKQPTVGAIPVDRWIPCSERLPEETGEWHNVIMSFDNGTTASGAWHDKELGFCLRYKDGWIKATGVNAWMPLPDPYKEKEHG